MKNTPETDEYLVTGEALAELEERLKKIAQAAAPRRARMGGTACRIARDRKD